MWGSFWDFARVETLRKELAVHRPDQCRSAVGLDRCWLLDPLICVLECLRMTSVGVEGFCRKKL